jgi:methylase of polypeptide subunit release factors
MIIQNKKVYLILCDNMENLQKKQLNFQTPKMQHEDYFTNIELASPVFLKNFFIKKGVLPPEKVTALYLAKWLYFNNGLYYKKKVLDIGCGTGIQGIVMGLFGAKKVIFSDISKKAILNTTQNINEYGLNKKSKIIVGDLFENIKTKFDVIVFNHPFFSEIISEDLIALATQEKGDLIHRFLETSKQYLNLNGIIIMPYFQIAGKNNDPFVQAPKHGFLVKRIFYNKIHTELHKGRASICILRLKNEFKRT